MTEINKLREHQKHYNAANKTPGERFDSTPVYYLDSGFAKRFSFLNNRGLEQRVQDEVRRLMSYKVVLMLYFPQMQEATTPAYNSDSEGDNSEDKDMHEYYTPFLVEMIPKEHSIMLFQKKMLEDENEDEDEEEETYVAKKQQKLSAVCLEIF